MTFVPTVVTDDAQVAQPKVVLAQTYGQLDDLVPKSWPAGPAAGIGPAAADQSAMPAEDRLRGDEERCPPFAWCELGQRREERTVRPGKAGTGNLAAQDGVPSRVDDAEEVEKSVRHLFGCLQGCVVADAFESH